MKCPKCGYLGFERVDRCRNCGYDFALADNAVAELTLQDRATGDEGPPDQLLTLSKEADAPRSGLTPDLPLFGRQSAQDEPLITKPSPPRPPLAVRRSTPEGSRVRVDSRAQSFDLTFDAEPGAGSAGLRRAVRLSGAAMESARASALSVGPDKADASLGARFLAMLIDCLILIAVDVLVVYLTLAFCGVSFDEINMLPKAPLLAFLFVQNCGYFVAFTVGGQTLGKMAAGIKVVAADPGEPLDLGRSVRRTLLCCLLAVPAGLGLLTALFNRDRRGLHDRLAGTRVVRASA